MPIEITDLRSEQDARAQLTADLRALRGVGGQDPHPRDVFTRPAVLRRLARVMAQHVPPGTDRLVALEGGDSPLAAAVALTTGVPFVLVDGEDAPFGELHAAEQVVVIAADESRRDRAARAAHDVGATVAAALLVELSGDRAGTVVEGCASRGAER